MNIFRTGLFENPYLDIEESVKTVGRPAFAEKGYESQLKSVTLLKNKNHTLPLKEGLRVYVPDRFIKSYLNFMSKPTGDRHMVPAGKKAASDYFQVVDTPDAADAALCFIESPISVGYDPNDRSAGGHADTKKRLKAVITGKRTARTARRPFVFCHRFEYPMRLSSTSLATSRPSRIAQTTSDCPLRASPAAKTCFTPVA